MQLQVAQPVPGEGLWGVGGCGGRQQQKRMRQTAMEMRLRPRPRPARAATSSRAWGEAGGGGAGTRLRGVQWGSLPAQVRPDWHVVVPRNPRLYSTRRTRGPGVRFSLRPDPNPTVSHCPWEPASVSFPTSRKLERGTCQALTGPTEDAKLWGIVGRQWGHQGVTKAPAPSSPALHPPLSVHPPSQAPNDARDGVGEGEEYGGEGHARSRA